MTDLIADTLAAVERCYDAIPRVAGARVESVGPFELFLRSGLGWPYYARPRLGTGTVSVAEVDTVRARQRELGAPEAIEWVHDLVPSLLAAVETSGLPVTRAPLMVLDPARLGPPSVRPEVSVFLLDPDSPDLADMWAQSSAVANLGFATAGTAIGAAGPAERDAAIVPTSPEMLDFVRTGLRRPGRAEALVRTAADGIVARGALQGANGAAEIVGVATLPAARRRGLGAAVSAHLARHALATGHELVFLGAASEDVARVYAGVGFHRIGTACIAELHH